MASSSALAAFFLSLNLCAAQIFYAEKGSPAELPCPCAMCSEERREVRWYFDQNGSPMPIFHRAANGSVHRGLDAWDRLEMLQSYALYFSNVTDSDTGRYWCEQRSQIYYDLVVVTGTKQMMEPEGTTSLCYVLSCSVSVDELDRDVAIWWEGQEKLQKEDKKRRYCILKGQRASLLHICLKRDEERTVRCCFSEKLAITFSLTGTAKDSSPGCQNQSLESRGNKGPSIALAVFVAVQFLIILALGVAVWRNHSHQKHQDRPMELRREASEPRYTLQVYENVRT